MDGKSPLGTLWKLYHMLQCRGQRDCHLEAATASEATKMAVRSNLHMDTRVINVSDYKFVVKLTIFIALVYRSQ